jgi:hypothetical protein
MGGERMSRMNSMGGRRSDNPTMFAQVVYQRDRYDQVIRRNSCACIKHGCVGTTRTLKP